LKTLTIGVDNWVCPITVRVYCYANSKTMNWAIKRREQTNGNSYLGFCSSFQGIRYKVKGKRGTKFFEAEMYFCDDHIADAIVVHEVAHLVTAIFNHMRKAMAFSEDFAVMVEEFYVEIITWLIQNNRSTKNITIEHYK